VGLTPEQRDQHALCGAKRRNGEPCRKYSGEGTDHFGVGRCKYHGGATRSHRKNAVELEAKRRMVKLGEPLADARPHAVLLGLLRASAGHVSWLQSEVGGLHDLGTHESQVIIRLHDEERDRLVRIAKSCSEAGVELAEVQLQQAQALTIGHAVRSAAEEIGLGGAQLKALGTALRKHLADASGDPDLAGREDARLRSQVDRLRADEERRVEREASKRRPPDLTYPPEEWVADEPSPA